MRTDLFNFTLPPELIAQQPMPQRDQARLMVLNRADQSIQHRRIADLPEFLHGPDVLIVNDTKVIPARVQGRKQDTGGKVEILLLEEVAVAEWDVLMRCSRRPAPGTRLEFGAGQLVAVMIADGPRGHARLKFESDRPLLDLLEDIGQPPLPPYIHRDAAAAPTAAADPDRDRYQTIYAREPGAVAAPTAGLHFTPALFEALAAQGVHRQCVTLHVGIGTFRPVTTDQVEAHEMESERYTLPAATAQACLAARAAGGRIVAVGSTSVRTLETVAAATGTLQEHAGRSTLYIYPPYPFQAVDVMMTNFHLPQSTLVMMVSAFAGREFALHAYEVAVAEHYRFYSYGDAMLIL